MSRAKTLLALIPLAALQFGITCGPPPSGMLAGMHVEVENQFVFGDGVYFLKVNVVVNADQPFQAYDVELQWDPANVQLLEQGSLGLPKVHPEFDDDGVFFAPVELDQQAGLARNIVDLRHGGAGVAGSVRIASAWFYAPTGGQAVIQAAGEVAAPDGTAFSVVSGRPLVFPPQ